jgi:hypothetical protein
MHSVLVASQHQLHVYSMGIKEWAWEAGFIAVSSRRDLDTPAMREG